MPLNGGAPTCELARKTRSLRPKTLRIFRKRCLSSEHKLVKPQPRLAQHLSFYRGTYASNCQNAPYLAILSGVVERRLLPRPERCSSGGKVEDPGTSTPGQEGLAGDPPPSDNRAGSRVGSKGWAPPTATGDPHSRDRRDSRREDRGQSHGFRARWTRSGRPADCEPHSSGLALQRRGQRPERSRPHR